MRLLARSLVAGALLVATSSPAQAAPNPLRFDLRVDLPVLVVSGAAAGTSGLPQLAPSSCRWCGAGDLDQDVRGALLWKDPAGARTASDMLMSAVLPLGAVGALALAAHQEGSSRTFLEDTIVVGQAVTLSTALTNLAKVGVARQRPGTVDSMAGSRNKSFYSGHTSFAFALATSTATLATLRGYRSAPWLWAAGMVLASTVGYLRVAGDAHWLSDVVVGAAAGGGVGFAVPWLHRPGARAGPVELVPAPGGFALLFP